MDKNLKPAENQIFYTTINDAPLELKEEWFYKEPKVEENTDILENNLEEVTETPTDATIEVYKELKILSNTYENGLGIIEFNIPIIELGEISFFENEYLKEISLPDSINHYNSALFSGCINLEYVNLPKFITKIRNNMFSYCRKLCNIDLPESIKELEDLCFSETGIKNIDLKNIEILGNGVFAKSKLYGTFNTSNVKKCGIQILFGTKIETLIIDESLEKLDDFTFQYCPLLENVIFKSKKISYIPNNCFSQCENIDELILPKTIKSFAGDAFYGIRKVIINE